MRLLFLLAFSLSAAETAPSLPARHLNVPNVRQATGYSCGAAALMAALTYWGVYDGGEARLAGLLGTDPENGTPVTALLDVARRFEVEAEGREAMTTADLRAALAKGDTVILDIQAWAGEKGAPLRGAQWRERWEDGHYVVLIAMDEANAYFMDPSVLPGYGWLPLDELPERWRDYDGKGRSVRRYRNFGLIIRGKKPADPPVLTRID